MSIMSQGIERMDGLFAHLMNRSEPFIGDKYIKKISRCIWFPPDADVLRSPEERETGIRRLLALGAERLKSGKMTRKQYQVYTLLLRVVGENMFIHDDLRIFFRLLQGELQPDERIRAIRGLAGGVFSCAGKDISHTLLFCEAYADAIARAIEKNAVLLPEKQEEWTRKMTLPLLGLTYGSAAIPSLPEYPQKRWIELLIEHAQNGNNAVDRYLTMVIEILCTQSRKLGITIQSDLEKDLAAKGISLLEYKPGEFNYGEPCLVIPDRLYDKLESFIIFDERQAEAAKRKAEQFRAWYQQHRDLVVRDAEQKLQEIKTHYRFAIRSGGLDRIAVTLSELQWIGLESFSFFPEGDDIRILLSVRKDVYVTCHFWARIHEGVLEAESYIFDNRDDTDVDYLRELFRCIVIDALHYIIVHGESNSSCWSCVGGNSYALRKARPKRYRMRPRLRNLPDGWKASPDAHARAEALHWNIPPGKTFVREHDRNCGGEDSLDTTPLFVCSDELYLAMHAC